MAETGGCREQQPQESLQEQAASPRLYDRADVHGGSQPQRDLVRRKHELGVIALVDETGSGAIQKAARLVGIVFLLVGIWWHR